MITRIARIKGYREILAGRDLANIFKEGHVYQVQELMGEIMIKDLGKHAHREGLTAKSGHKFSTIMLDGTYLLSEYEYKQQLKAENDEFNR